MADLDNFFAKKDKKKVKGRKYDNLDVIEQRLKETELRLEKERVKTEPVTSTLDEVLSTAAPTDIEGSQTDKKAEKEEEEWKDFQDDTQKDLSNLKISQLQINSDDEGTGIYGSGEDEGGLGEDSSKTGVWNTSNVEPVIPDKPVAVEQTNVPSKESLNSSYVPPHMRNMQASPLPRGENRKLKTAPDITNSAAFPSLADAQTGVQQSPWGKKRDDLKGFDSVKHGTPRSFTSAAVQPQKVSTSNRFDALSERS